MSAWIQLDGDLRSDKESEETLWPAFIAWLKEHGATFDGYAYAEDDEGNDLTEGRHRWPEEDG